MIEKVDVTNTSIGIVGLGYVGEAMVEFFESYNKGGIAICAYDILPKDKINSYRDVYLTDKDNLNTCDLGVVCVPTPQKEDGSCDISIVEEVISWLQTPLILLKSTVPPGTTDYLSRKYNKRIVFSPEYCGESSYWTPYKFHTEIIETPFFTFGGNPKDTSKIVDIFLPITGPVKQYRQTTALAAELAKYMENCFYATKITFCYEMAQICKTIGADYNEVRELWLLDPRINPMHTCVFEKNTKPFSGKCLPKDLSALIAYSKQAGYSPALLQEVCSSNERIGACRAS